ATGQLTVAQKLNVQRDPAAGAAPEMLTGPLTLQPGRAPLVFRRPYRGFIQLQVVGTHLQVVNVIGLDNYVRGVVTGEMPKDWPFAALEAQAVAARSYAVATLGDGKILYTDQRSQVYGGVEGESPPGVAAGTPTD